jgi:nucleoside-diphosphate-sugar epimerase
MATYLVTGAAGFIAAKVIELLLVEGHTIIGIDNLNDAYDVRLKYWRLDQIKQHPNFTFHRLDICDKQGLNELFKEQATSSQDNFAAVINLAARAGVRQSVENPWLYFDTNTTGTLNLLELCKTFEVPKFLLASTSSVYGKDNPMPWQEEQNTSRPLSPYAASKKAAEVLCHTYHYLYGIDITVYRYFTVYGPAGRPDMSLFRFVQWINEGRPVKVFGDGLQTRDFTYVEDIARGTIAGLKPLGYETINLGSDTPVILIEAIKLIEELVGKKANLYFEERHSADTPASWANIAKANRVLGWRSQFPFHQGVEQLVSWYQKNHLWAKELQS